MIHAYSEIYLNDAKKTLASMFDYAVYDFHTDGNWFSTMFVQSGIAAKFEVGNPSIISGTSGAELALQVLQYAYRDTKFPEVNFYQDRSPEYWAGWALAEYQWYSGKRFKDIFMKVPFSEIVAMYNVYHEMDITHFIEEMERRYSSFFGETRLKRVRENRGLSQNELALHSGVKLRSIQMYEQRVNDIDKAQGKTLYRLSRILGCSVEDLLENPMN